MSFVMQIIPLSKWTLECKWLKPKNDPQLELLLILMKIVNDSETQMIII